jgi:hypothetical protein
MTTIESAERIVDIAALLRTNAVLPEQREILCAEQSALWEAEYPNRPFESIARDVWLFRSYR